ncbi:MAG: hypothetical protein SNJ71_01860 [Bacteroidales bacterium]
MQLIPANENDVYQYFYANPLFYTECGYKNGSFSRQLFLIKNKEIVGFCGIRFVSIVDFAHNANIVVPSLGPTYIRPSFRHQGFHRFTIRERINFLLKNLHLDFYRTDFVDFGGRKIQLFPILCLVDFSSSSYKNLLKENFYKISSQSLFFQKNVKDEMDCLYVKYIFYPLSG